MDKRAFVLAIIMVVCGTMIAIAAVDPKAYQDTPATAKVRPVQKTKVIVKHEIQTMPVNRPDGYVSRAACGRINPSMSIQDLMWHYGWPAGDNGEDSYSGVFYYPSRDNHADTCVVDTAGGHVLSTQYTEG